MWIAASWYGVRSVFLAYTLVSVKPAPAFEAGAGFTDTKVYAKKTDLTPYQEAALHIYDARDYALNGTNVPFVGYGGEIDPQLQASKNIREQLVKEGVNLDTLRA